MKQIWCVLFLGVGLLARGDWASEDFASMSPGKQKAMAKVGGRVMRPGSQKGEIAILNGLSEKEGAWLKESADYLAKTTRFNVTTRVGACDRGATLKPNALAIYVVDDAKEPTMLVAPEDRWALVNMAKLRSEKEPFSKARLQKEVSRAFALLCGGAASSFKEALPGCATKAADLDRFVSYHLPVDVVARFTAYLRPFGVTPAMITTYKVACQQGWAPAPSNDMQKAVWDEVHATPSEPIKIAPETKKVEK